MVNVFKFKEFSTEIQTSPRWQIPMTRKKKKFLSIKVVGILTSALVALAMDCHQIKIAMGKKPKAITAT